MTTPTQSPATAAAEAILERWVIYDTNRYGDEITAKIEDVTAIIQSAYSSAEQELREARRLLGCVKSTFEFIHDECDWNGLDRQGTGGGDDRIGPSCANAIDDLSTFLSKPSNLPRE